MTAFQCTGPSMYFQCPKWSHTYGYQAHVGAWTIDANSMAMTDRFKKKIFKINNELKWMKLLSSLKVSLFDNTIRTVLELHISGSSIANRRRSAFMIHYSFFTLDSQYVSSYLLENYASIIKLCLPVCTPGKRLCFPLQWVLNQLAKHWTILVKFNSEVEFD